MNSHSKDTVYSFRFVSRQFRFLRSKGVPDLEEGSEAGKEACVASGSPGPAKINLDFPHQTKLKLKQRKSYFKPLLKSNQSLSRNQARINLSNQNQVKLKLKTITIRSQTKQNKPDHTEK
jgi:hypothetical protein